MDQINQILYWITTGLLIPVILLLLIYFVRALVMLGSFYNGYTQKRKAQKNLNEAFAQVNSSNVALLLSELQNFTSIRLGNAFKRMQEVEHKDMYLDKILNDYEVGIQEELAASQSLGKMGPILGLMGTLIPMGPALVGLASGDIASMATNMQMAFATTVIGLLIGAIGFTVLQVKKRWCMQEMNELEFIVELLKDKA